MRVPVVVGIVVIVIAAGSAAWWFTRSAEPVPATAAVPAAKPATPPPVALAPTREPTPASSASARPAVRRAAPAETAAAAPVEAAPTTATLHVEADVADASVFIDRIGVGSVPMTIPNLAPGAHRLNVSAPGYDGYSEDLALEPGERTVRVAFKEVRLDAKIDAVHKHGMGSCKGQLVASVEGLRYVAADGKDNVTITFADMDTFDVDVLAKNLRVKTKQGKTLNFTDPAGDGNRLFVFHRDVDKARKRLLAAK